MNEIKEAQGEQLWFLVQFPAKHTLPNLECRGCSLPIPSSGDWMPPYVLVAIPGTSGGGSGVSPVPIADPSLQGWKIHLWLLEVAKLLFFG